MFYKLCLCFLCIITHFAYCSVQEAKLVKTLFRGYNKLIRPVVNSNDHVVIKMDLVLLQLINVYEKEQIMKTNVWITLKWTDFQLMWSASEYEVNSIRVPYDKVWTPDIVLFNNADGNYEASYKSNAVIYSTNETGYNILCIPPAIYKSSCTIDVTYFPFDQQECEMRFGSWTFDANQVRLESDKVMANLDDYLSSGTWDVIDAPSKTVEYDVDGTKRMELIYTFRIRRKTLFYTVNLIIPTVLISFLSIFVFYLPTDEGEKMTLCISILLALVVFLLLVSKILPPTSIVIPLIAKYLLFTLIMNIVTILNTVIIINWNYRTPRTHNMPRWVRIIFMEFLPKILFMKRPIRADNVDNVYTEPSIGFVNTHSNDETDLVSGSAVSFAGYGARQNTAIRKASLCNKKITITSSISGDCSYNANSINMVHTVSNSNSKTKERVINRTETIPLTNLNKQNNFDAKALQQPLNYHRTHKKQQQHTLLNNYIKTKKDKSSRDKSTIVRNRTYFADSDDSISLKRTSKRKHNTKSQSFDSDLFDYTTSCDEYSNDILDAADKIVYITNHIKNENDYQEVREDWKYVALVIDRLQLYIFFMVTVIGSAWILLKAPHIFEFVDQQEHLRKIKEANS